jgi:hypothetical protein
MSNTYTLKSAAWIYTPSMVALAIDQFATNPKWSVKLLTDGFSLPVRVAKGLASGAISYEVKDESVIFKA